VVTTDARLYGGEYGVFTVSLVVCTYLFHCDYYFVTAQTYNSISMEWVKKCGMTPQVYKYRRRVYAWISWEVTTIVVLSVSLSGRSTTVPWKGLLLSLASVKVTYECALLCGDLGEDVIIIVVCLLLL